MFLVQGQTVSPKEAPGVTEKPRRFAQEFNIITQTYQPGFPDLCACKKKERK